MTNTNSGLSYRNSEVGSVALGDNSTLPVAGELEMELPVDLQGSSSVLKLGRVLIVPGLKRKLISVSQLTKTGYNVNFLANKEICEISKGNKLIAIAKLKNELWVIMEQYKSCFDDVPEFDHTTLNTESITEPSVGLEFVSNTQNLQRKNDNVKFKPNRLHYWHLRFNHASVGALETLSKTNAVRGLKLSKEDLQLPLDCLGCALGKQHREPFSRVVPPVERRPLELVHSDLVGPIEVEIVQGHKKYILTLIDDYSWRSWIYLIAKKSDVQECLRDWISKVERQSGKSVQIIRTDNGGEYIPTILQNWLKEKGIEVQFTIPDSPQQNGIAERFNRTLLEGIRAALHGSGLSKGFWGEAALCLNFTRNRLPTRGNKSG